MQMLTRLGDQAYSIGHITTNLMVNRRGQITSRHRHPVFHLMYITEGMGRFYINDQVSIAKPGLLYLINPNEWHMFTGDETEGLSNFECTFVLQQQREPVSDITLPDLMELHGLSSQFNKSVWSPFRVPVHLHPILVEGFSRMIDAGQSFYTHRHLALMVADLLYRIEGIAMQTLGRPTLQAEYGQDARIASVKQFLKSNLSRTVTLKETADFIHLAPTYLCRIFKEHTGESPMEYLLAQRMQEAQKLLSLTDLPVYLIASKVGFEDASYFARIFSKKIGAAPLKYRQQLYEK